MNRRQNKKFNKKLGHKKWAYVKQVLRRNKEWAKKNPEMAKRLKPFIWDGKSAIAPFNKLSSKDINGVIKDRTDAILKAMAQGFCTGDIGSSWGVDKDGSPIIMDFAYGTTVPIKEGFIIKDKSEVDSELFKPDKHFIEASSARKQAILEMLEREKKEQTGEITPEEIQARKRMMLNTLGVYGSLTDADKFYEEVSEALNKGGDENGGD